MSPILIEHFDATHYVLLRYVRLDVTKFQPKDKREWCEETQNPDRPGLFSTGPMKKHLRVAERKLPELKHAVQEIKIRSSLPTKLTPNLKKIDSKLLDSPYLQPVAPDAWQRPKLRDLPASFWKWVEAGLSLYEDIKQELKAFARDGVEVLLKDKDLEEACIRRIQISLEAEIYKCQDKDIADISVIINALRTALNEQRRKLRKKPTKPPKIQTGTTSGTMNKQKQGNVKIGTTISNDGKIHAVANHDDDMCIESTPAQSAACSTCGAGTDRLSRRSRSSRSSPSGCSSCGYRCSDWGKNDQLPIESPMSEIVLESTHVFQYSIDDDKTITRSSTSWSTSGSSKNLKADEEIIRQISASTPSGSDTGTKTECSSEELHYSTDTFISSSSTDSSDYEDNMVAFRLPSKQKEKIKSDISSISMDFTCSPQASDCDRSEELEYGIPRTITQVPLLFATADERNKIRRFNKYIKTEAEEMHNKSKHSESASAFKTVTINTQNAKSTSSIKSKRHEIPKTFLKHDCQDKNTKKPQVPTNVSKQDTQSSLRQEKNNRVNATNVRDNSNDRRRTSAQGNMDLKSMKTKANERPHTKIGKSATMSNTGDACKGNQKSSKLKEIKMANSLKIKTDDQTHIIQNGQRDRGQSPKTPGKVKRTQNVTYTAVGPETSTRSTFHLSTSKQVCAKPTLPPKVSRSSPNKSYLQHADAYILLRGQTRGHMYSVQAVQRPRQLAHLIA